MRDRASEQCVCGHTFEDHEHYRAGTDCAQCDRGDCLRLRSTRSLRTRLALLLGKADASGGQRGSTLAVPPERPHLYLVVSRPA